MELGERKQPARDQDEKGQNENAETEDHTLLEKKEETNGIPEEAEDDTRCGLGWFHPPWLQKFASKKAYTIMHGLVGMSGFLLGAYFKASITTLEKRFKISSRTSGIISGSSDFGVILTVVGLTYFGSRGRKPHWVAAGTVLVGLSCFVRFLPHLIYGPGHDALLLTAQYGANTSTVANVTTNKAINLCTEEAAVEDDGSCDDGGGSIVPPALFILANVIKGVGNSAYYTLGMAYLDDNALKNKSPILMAVSQCFKMVGPTFGFMLASFALSKYVATNLTPVISEKDPRWIGAWWLAWIPIGMLEFVLAILIALFPKILPRAAQRKSAKPKKAPPPKRSFNDFGRVLWRLMRTPLLVLNTLSSVCFMFGYVGYWTFMPKYMETQYHQTASKASMYTGAMGLGFTALGLLSSSIFISRFKPRPRSLAAWNVVLEILDVCIHILRPFLSCPSQNLQGSWDETGSWNLTSACNEGCNCSPELKYAPVCSEDGLATFYSACHAGCTESSLVNGTMMYSNCSCIGGSGRALPGACFTDCATNFTVFIVLQCLMSFLGATGRAGNLLLQFRCVDEDDKSLSIAFTEILLCALAYSPGPVVYGALLDAACMVWGKSCGKRGNCWLYNGQVLRYQINFTAAGFLIIGTILDIGVWYHAKGIKVYDEDDAKENVDASDRPDT